MIQEADLRLYRTLQATPDGQWTLKEMATECRTSKAQVARSLRALQAVGLVKVHVQEDT